MRRGKTQIRNAKRSALRAIDIFWITRLKPIRPSATDARIRAGQHAHSLPVVILTTSIEEQDIAQSYDQGANSYISKPEDFAWFAGSVGHLGLYWLLWRVSGRRTHRDGEDRYETRHRRNDGSVFAVEVCVQ
jgi:hypothetical protein